MKAVHDANIPVKVLKENAKEMKKFIFNLTRQVVH